MNWMRTILLCFLICINSTLLLRSDWVVPLEFSVSGSEFRHFGKIIISTTNEATFSETEFDISNQLIESFKVALADNLTYPTYRIRTRDVESSTFPCLFVLSNFAHEISISVDLERQQIFSINMFPYGIYDISGTKEELYCQIDDLLAIQPKLTVKVNLIKQEELPGPHTAAHLQRIEEEKRSRQHGATQDNRSFIAKYWMYIVPVVIFVVVSNAFNIDQGNDINSSPTAAKVAEVFLTAGHAFQKLGDLTLRLNQPISENTNETKWSEKDVDKLKEALSRFAHDLDNISDSVQSRIVQKIKTDIKRRTLISGGPSDPMLRTPLNTSIGGSNTTHFSGITFSSAISPASSSTSQGLGLSSNIGSIYSTAGSTQNQSFNRDVKNEYAASPPQLIPNSSTVQQNHNNRIIHSGNVGNSGFCGGIKRNALSSVSYGGSINLNNGSRVISSSVNGAPPFKKTTYGSGSGVITTFRPIRTISAAVNSSPGGGRSVSLLRSGITSQHNASNPNLSMQQHRLQSNQNINHSIHHNTPIFELDDDELDAINASGKLSGVHLPSINQQL